MRRALVLLSFVSIALIVVPPASAGPSAGRGETEREVTFYLHQDGFTIIFDTTDDDGEESAFLGIQRGRLTARYFAPAVVTANTVKARFGDLGELDYRYAPIGDTESSAVAGEKPDTRFEGTFTFTGENEYIRLDLGQVDGFLNVYRPPGAHSSRAPRQRRKVPYRPSYSDQGATLDIVGGSKRSKSFREVSVFDPGGKGRHKIMISGQLLERRPGGLDVARGAAFPMGAGAFRWNLDTDTATLKPHAPFTGSARFTARGDGPGIWTGSLSVPILGGEPVELAGPGFRGHLREGVPVDE